MPLAKSQVLILSNLHHSREPFIEGTNCHKMDVIMETSSIETVSPVKCSASQSSSISTLKHQPKGNPWEPMFKNYEAFIDAHTC